MTPLAQAILNDYAQPTKDRKFKDQSGLLPTLTGAHCFECTDVFDLASDLAERTHRKGKGATLRGTFSFLPAPVTWLEWQRGEEDGRGREGVLLCAEEGQAVASSIWAYKGNNLFLSAKKRGALILEGDGSLEQEYLAVRDFANEGQDEICGWVAQMYALLALINSPKVIGRRQHMPHAGLQRRLAASRGMAGKFPLLAWTEIVLETCVSRYEGHCPSRETHLTGARAYHHVRKHARIVDGQVVYVRAHWRGDPSLGMKQSRYTVIPPRNGAPAFSPAA